MCQNVEIGQQANNCNGGVNNQNAGNVTFGNFSKHYINNIKALKFCWNLVSLLPILYLFTAEWNNQYFTIFFFVLKPSIRRRKNGNVSKCRLL